VRLPRFDEWMRDRGVAASQVVPLVAAALCAAADTPSPSRGVPTGSCENFRPSDWACTHTFRLGSPPVDAIECPLASEDNFWHKCHDSEQWPFCEDGAASYQGIFVWRGSKVQRVLAIPREIRMNDSGAGGGGGVEYIRFYVKLADDGVSADVGSDPPCAEALAAARKDEEGHDHGLLRAIEGACAAEGHYVWRNDEFRR